MRNFLTLNQIVHIVTTRHWKFNVKWRKATCGQNIYKEFTSDWSYASCALTSCLGPVLLHFKRLIFVEQRLQVPHCLLDYDEHPLSPSDVIGIPLLSLLWASLRFSSVFVPSVSWWLKCIRSAPAVSFGN